MRLKKLPLQIAILAACGAAQLGRPVFAIGPSPNSPTLPPAGETHPSAPGLRSVSDKLPVHFIENGGQVDPRVAFYVQGLDKVIYFAPDGVTVVLSDRSKRHSRHAAVTPLLSGTESSAEDAAANAARRVTLKLDFVSANPLATPIGRELAPALVSYFKGPHDAWKTGLKTYTQLVYADLWPGIDLIYRGTVNRLKYMFVVKPGADPERIKLRYRGVDSVLVNDHGQLEVRTALGSFHDDKPFAYQEVSGKLSDVGVGYDLRPEADSASALYGFRLGAYDPAQSLIIDPAILVYAGFIGGSGDDRGNGIALDAGGNAYVTGETASTELTLLPTVGPDFTQNGGGDAFVAKVDPSGTSFVYIGFIGGSGDDRGKGIAVDASGNAYVVGETTSTATTFPTIVGPGLTQNGSIDAFVTKVNASGTALVYAGYIGGVGDDRGKAIALEPGCVTNCSAYVTGETSSTQTTFPATMGPDLIHNGGVDAFVAKVNATGTGLVYAGYIGGTGDDRGNGIAVDAAGSAYVTGETSSTQTTFPATAGPDLTHNGGVDAFVAKVNSAGTGLTYAGYIGGSGNDRGNAIALMPGCPMDCNAYITGETNSDQITFPDGDGFGALPGPDLTHNGAVDAFVAKINSAGTGLTYAGYIGGSGDDRGKGIAVDGAGNAYVTGETSSTETTFPATVGPDLTHNGGVDAFVAQVNSIGSGLVFAGYIGGSGDDRGNGVAVTANGDVYVTGETNSTELTFPEQVGPDQTQNLGFDAFVAKICNSVCPDLRVTQTDSPDPVTVGANLNYTITVTNHGPDGATGVELTDVLPSTVTLVSATPSVGTCTGTTTVICALGSLANGASAMVTIVVTTTAVGNLNNTASVTADQADSDLTNNVNTERTVATLSNLVVKTINAVAAVIPGSDIVVNDTTTNNGKVDAGASVTKFYLSTDAKFDTGDVLLVPFGGRPVPALAPKQSSSGATTVTIPLATALGRYFLIGVADADSAVAETKENNKKARRLNVALPDLTVSGLKGPSSATQGASIVIQETTNNKAPVPAAGSTTKFFLSTDTIFDGSDVLLGSRAVPALATKGKSAGSTTGSVPLATAPGNYFVIAVADADGGVPESIEGNNVQSRPITITP